MKKTYSTGWLFGGTAMLFCMILSIAQAANKVVVVPLNSAQKTSCTAFGEVLSAGNQCWKDRNLGASRVAISSTDSAAYGDLYQWGRLGDGHQNRDSSATSNLNYYDVPGHSSFITEQNWRSSANRSLWQGLGGINNPCPQGFRVPTINEMAIEVSSWGNTPDAEDAFASPLKLVMAGYRSYDGNFTGANTVGIYWSSVVYDSSNSIYYSFSSIGAGIGSKYYGEGLSIRCIKD